MLSAAVVVLSAVFVPAPVRARGAEDPTSELQRTRQRRKELSAELALLHASDAQLEAKLASLEKSIRAQQAKVDGARAELAAARVELSRLRARLEASEERLRQERRRARRHAVAAYMRTGSSFLAEVLGSSDLREATAAKVLLGRVARKDRQVVETLTRVAAERRRDLAAVQEAEERLRSAEREASERLADLRATRDEENEVRSVLAARIRQYEEEVDALAAHEADLVSLIRSRQGPPPRGAGGPATSVRPPGSRSGGSTTTPTQPTTTRDSGGSGGGSPPTTAPTSVTSRPRETTTTTATPTTAPATTIPGLSLIWPVNGVVTSRFGWRWGRMHNGIDIAAPTGTPIRASESGEVIFAGWMGGYGQLVVVAHSGGLSTLYAHQSEILVPEGARVSKGEVIGLVGCTGTCTGPHVHFETREWGVAVDPLRYLP